MSQPPLKALHYFCVTARFLSFRQAADELSVTPGAVSQQVKQLENWLGLELFERSARQVSMTGAGSMLYRRIEPQLASVLEVSSAMRRINRSDTVRLSTPPGFALIRLGPALADFRREHPEVELQLHASSLLADLDGSAQDMAIRYLPEADPALDCTCLGRLTVLATCSPDYLDAHPGLAHGDLSGCTLIHDHLHTDWGRMIEAGELTGQPRDKLHFDHATLAQQATEGGLGLWLTDRMLSGPLLDSGRLVQLFNEGLPAKRHLYLVHSHHAPLSSAMLTTKQWLQSRFAAESLALNG